ncbi:MAG: cytochrome C biogenesis protein [Alphaproteobacteria bacterium HGW-Alphaproteobacteria-3]|nr:MAG: cytochrome C biogenesis protein [Alphaproteobacteria bacterium HGW-Alphaproteobacteria-3]
MTPVFLAFLAGALTLLNPCVLPLLPIVVGTAFQENRWGPVALAAGLTASFTLIGIPVLAFGFSLGIDTETVRQLGAYLLIAFGIVLAVPAFQAVLAAKLAPLVSGAGGMAAKIAAPGLAGQFTIGALLGIVWAPCAGPTLGAAIASASQARDLTSSFVIFGFFGIGVSAALLVFAYASRATLAKRKQGLQRFSNWAKPVFGALLVIVGGMIVTGYDKVLEAVLLDAMPSWLIRLTTSV